MGVLGEPRPAKPPGDLPSIIRPLGACGYIVSNIPRAIGLVWKQVIDARIKIHTPAPTAGDGALHPGRVVLVFVLLDLPVTVGVAPPELVLPDFLSFADQRGRRDEPVALDPVYPILVTAVVSAGEGEVLFASAFDVQDLRVNQSAQGVLGAEGVEFPAGRFIVDLVTEREDQ